MTETCSNQQKASQLSKTNPTLGSSVLGLEREVLGETDWQYLDFGRCCLSGSSRVCSGSVELPATHKDPNKNTDENSEADAAHDYGADNFLNMALAFRLWACRMHRRVDWVFRKA